jgi:hypothetical protein
MYNDVKGPIEHFSWGKFIVCGKEHSKIANEKTGFGKDIRLIGKEVSKWKEREGHSLNSKMITGIFNKGIEILIIGIGVNGLIECPENVREYIKSNGIKNIIIEKTPEACRIYNEFFNNGEKVALLAHGTC